MSSGPGGSATPLLYSLSRRQIADIYANQVEPELASQGPPAQTPRFIIIGGQQGSGKTTAINAAVHSLGNEPVQRITVDNLMAYYPGYAEAAEKDSRQAQHQTGSTPGEWAHKLMQRAFDKGHHVILELAPPHNVSEVLLEAKMRGYQTELRVIGVQPERSWTSVVSRYERALTDGIDEPRYVDRAAHDTVYEKWPAKLFDVERDKLADKISVRDRTDQVSYSNQLVASAGGQPHYDKPERAMENLIIARSAPLTDKDRSELQKAWDTNLKSPHLAKALPGEIVDFAQDRQQITDYANSPASRFNPHDRTTHVSAEAVQEWNSRVSADAINAFTTSTRSPAMQARVQAFIDVVQKTSTQALHNVQDNANQRTQAANVPPPANSQSQAPSAAPDPPQQNIAGSRSRGSK